MYLRNGIIAALLALSFSTSASATAPTWVQKLTRHESMAAIKEDQREEVTCLALAIYFEARGEPVRGQQAVGNVVMNRTRSSRYPNTACGVLFQRGQFSFVRKGPAVPKTPRLWENAIQLAHAVFRGNVNDVSNGALSFCQRRLRKSGYLIGNHIFFS